MISPLEGLDLQCRFVADRHAIASLECLTVDLDSAAEQLQPGMATGSEFVVDLVSLVDVGQPDSRILMYQQGTVGGITRGNQLQLITTTSGVE